MRTLWCEEARARVRVRESTHASVRGCAHIRARGSAHVVVRVREEAHTVYQVSLNFRTVTPLNCKILMKNL